MDKEKALDLALSQIEKEFGKGAIMLMGDAAQKIQVSVIPTGCIELDNALGVGGIPRGRIIEIYGPESSGKTTLALHMIAEAQKLGGMAVSSTRSTRSIPFTRRSWAFSSTPSSFLSPITASRRSISRIRSSGAAPST